MSARSLHIDSTESMMSQSLSDQLPTAPLLQIMLLCSANCAAVLPIMPRLVLTVYYLAHNCEISETVIVHYFLPVQYSQLLNRTRYLQHVL